METTAIGLKPLTIEFQKNILQYLLQGRAAVNIYQYLDKALLDLPEHKVIIDLLLKFRAEFEAHPSKIDLIEYLERNAIKFNLQNTKQITDYLDLLYIPFTEDATYIENTIIEFAQYQKSKIMLLDFGKKILNVKGWSSEMLSKLKSEMGSIIEMGKDFEEERKNLFDVINDYKETTIKKIEGYPILFDKWNEMLKFGGLVRGEIVVIGGASKGGKTQLMINIAVHYLNSGLNVLYIDLENGIDRIRTLFYQCLMNWDYKDLNAPHNAQLLKDKLNSIKESGAECVIRKLRPHKHTVEDVRDMLDSLQQKNGFKPDIIICDYYDIMGAADNKKEERFRIQSIYYAWKDLLDERQAIGITASQLNRGGQKNSDADSNSVANDIGKIFSCNQFWFFIRKTDDTAELRPEVIREGKIGQSIIVNIDFSRCKITEYENATTFKSSEYFDEFSGLRSGTGFGEDVPF